MRREVRDFLPHLLRYYGIKPWEVELLTLGELDRLMRDGAETRQRELQAHQALVQLAGVASEVG